MTHIGFTGTKEGMTDEQYDSVKALLVTLPHGSLHHGDCLGADAQAHEIATSLMRDVVIHPPDIYKYRAFCTDGVVKMHPEKAYLERNMDIAAACDVLIATPRTYGEQIRSGTWSTVRYARKLNRIVIVVVPNGSWSAEHNGVQIQLADVTSRLVSGRV